MTARALPLVLTVACVDGPGHAESPVMPDFELFVTEVEPALASCANPACHGRPDRPLAIYAPGLYRADPADTWVDTPLTEDESLENYRRACGFVVDSPDPLDCDLVCKPLAPAAGGCLHGGGVLHLDRSDPDHQLLVAWIQGDLEAP